MEKYVKFIEDFLHKALSLWFHPAHDVGGCFAEGLDFSGNIFHTPQLRSRVQSRQLYVYAQGMIHGYPLPLKDIHGVFACYVDYFWEDVCGISYSIDAVTLQKDKLYCSYEQAFLMLSCALLFKASRKILYQQWVYKTHRILKTYYCLERGYVENLFQNHKRSQNPHMHLFEAYLACYEVFEDPVFLNEADQLYTLMKQSFCLSSGGIVEYPDPSFPILQPYEDRETSPYDHCWIEPGHVSEWVWLLSVYGKLKPRLDNELLSTMRHLMLFVQRKGQASDGLVYDHVTERSPQGISKRLWCQAEALKGFLALYECTQQTRYLCDATRVLEGIKKYYLDPAQQLQGCSGLWIDHIEHNGDPRDTTYCPGSTLYHIFSAFHECLRILKR